MVMSGLPWAKNRQSARIDQEWNVLCARQFAAGDPGGVGRLQKSSQLHEDLIIVDPPAGKSQPTGLSIGAQGDSFLDQFITGVVEFGPRDADRVTGLRVGGVGNAEEIGDAAQSNEAGPDGQTRLQTHRHIHGR